MQPWVGRVGMFLYYYYYMYFFLLLLLLSTASSVSTSNSFQQPIHAIHLLMDLNSLAHFPISHFPISHFFVITVIHTNCLIIQRTAS